jgi:hypothetical protein
MTTTITVKTHAGWPVEVTTIEGGVAVDSATVEPNVERDFYVHSGRELHFKELPLPAAATAEPETAA